MSDLPAPVNATADEIDALIDAVLKGAAVRLAINAATAAQPWLRFPIIYQVFSWAVGFLLGKFDAFVRVTADDAVIDAQTNAEASDVQTAKAALRAALASGDPNAIQKASDDYDVALGRLIHAGT